MCSDTRIMRSESRMPHIVVLSQRINTVRCTKCDKLWIKQYLCYMQPSTGDKFKHSGTVYSVQYSIGKYSESF